MCPHEQENFRAVGFWYDVFTQVENEDVVALLDERERRLPQLLVAAREKVDPARPTVSSCSPYGSSAMRAAVAIEAASIAYSA